MAQTTTEIQTIINQIDTLMVTLMDDGPYAVGEYEEHGNVGFRSDPSRGIAELLKYRKMLTDALVDPAQAAGAETIITQFRQHYPQCP